MPIPNNPPSIQFTPITLTKGVDSVVIDRNVAFGNTLEYNLKRIFNDSDDFILSFTDATWPEYDVLQFDVFPITKTEADNLITFMTNHVGEIINLTINNITYSGLVAEPNLEIIDEKNDDCNFKVSFLFETETCV